MIKELAVQVSDTTNAATTTIVGNKKSMAVTVFKIESILYKLRPNKDHMNQKELSALTDQELLNEAKKMKTASIMNAVFIGFLIGIIFYSLIKNTWGFLTLIPLFLAYKLINNSKHNSKELEALLKQRNLK